LAGEAAAAAEALECAEAGVAEAECAGETGGAEAAGVSVEAALAALAGLTLCAGEACEGVAGSFVAAVSAQGGTAAEGNEEGSDASLATLAPEATCTSARAGEWGWDCGECCGSVEDCAVVHDQVVADEYAARARAGDGDDLVCGDDEIAFDGEDGDAAVEVGAEGCAVEGGGREVGIAGDGLVGCVDCYLRVGGACETCRGERGCVTSENG
jgi:hypothetical protein